MTNSQKIHIKIQELEKEAQQYINCLDKNPQMAELNKQMHNAIENQIEGLKMALRIIEGA